MRYLFLIPTLLLNLFMISCGGSSGSSLASYSSATLTGTINENSWTYGTAIASPSSTVSGTLDLRIISGTVENPCDEFILTADDNLLVAITAAPSSASEKLFSGTGHLANLANGSSNTLTDNAKIIIDTISDTSLTGRLVVNYDDDNNINGAFTAERCVD
jgi:hypothetical protein